MKRCVIMFSSHWRTSIDPLTFKWTVALQRFLQRRFKRRLEDFYKPSASADRLSIPPSSLCQNDGLYRFDSETSIVHHRRFAAVVMNPAFASSRMIPAGYSPRLRLTVCRQSLP